MAAPEKPPSVAGLFVPTMHGLRGWAIFIIFVFHAAIATHYVPHGELTRRRHGRALARRIGRGKPADPGAAATRAGALGTAPDRV